MYTSVREAVYPTTQIIDMRDGRYDMSGTILPLGLPEGIIMSTGMLVRQHRLRNLGIGDEIGVGVGVGSGMRIMMMRGGPV